MDERPGQGLPLGGVTNGDDMEFAHLDYDSELYFAQGDPKLLAGPGAIDPQDAPKLLTQTVPIMSVSFDRIEDNEFDPFLRDKEGLAVYHQMITDGTVANALNYLYGRMRSSNWLIEPASDDDQDIEIAAFVQEQLGIDDIAPNKYPFNRLFQLYKQSWIYGRSFGEIVLAMGPDGKAVLDKIIHINPFVIDQIEYDNDGGPKNVVVTGSIKGTGKQVNKKKVPIWKTVAFVRDDNGAFDGTSVLRAAVAHWRVKRALIVLMNSGMERYLVGVPMVKVPKAVRPGSKQWQMAQMVAKSFVTKPRTGVIVPPGWEFETVPLNVAMPDARPYLEYHDAAIARAIGIDFNTVRQNEGVQNMNIGAFVELTDNTVEQLMKDFCSAINTYLIPKLVTLNWPDARLMPRITYGLKTEEDFSAAANLMGMVINAAIAINQPKTSSGGADGAPASPAPTVSMTQVVDGMKEMMAALPPRFKKALGITDAELRERLNAYRTGASTSYKRDRRKPTPGL